MRNIRKFIKEKFPKREIIYRGEKFLFLADLKVKDMEKYTYLELKGIDRIKYMLKIFSYKPKLSKRTINSMPAPMLKELYELLFAKKEETSSPSEIIISNSLPKSSISPIVNSETGATTK